MEALLASWLEDRVVEAASLDEVFCDEVARPVADFVLRGGKRLRASFLWWGWRAAGGPGREPEARGALKAAASLELLQALALIHDDVMDRSETRRGRPALHVDFAARHRGAGMNGSPEVFGTSGAVLAGDLALMWAEDLFAEATRERAAPRGEDVGWRAMRAEMVAGQYLDLRTQAVGAFSPESALRVAALKTAAYTVRRPLGMGAALAGASTHTRRCLEAAGHSAGLAFQLRDDLDGVFGDPAATGKPAGEDVREGKATHLAALAWQRAEAREDHQALEVMRRVFADSHLGAEALQEYRHALVRVGARDAVTERIEALVKHATTELAGARLDSDAAQRLVDLVHAATRVVPGAPGAATDRRST
ncbi:polyprenyl synthetase family protein [Streptomyces sp. DSM 42041]|uniref:Polyprenyl synthetase family protein n=1 Tax=Streptomyces hazeniae TaxID=3075538 RepID=A0ABU2NMX7_9ACTN|nr:polyprenyl synthetase family protein [Streptomyces sp. DSM 42041]MDT0378339.1 polyprenyl synthetase family protein [Streptomyces sp. DSM 42041]